ncbi:MAG: DNA primase [Burkholderiaceae bacterium]|nr:DNA primase [Burkholderiaceae bacterium]
MISPTFIQDLLGRVDISDVVGRYVKLKKSGANHMGLCPFHGEKSPSFAVSPSRQTYHCFGCGVHGNAIGFLMEHSGMGFVDAVHDLAQQVGLSVPEDDRSPEERERALKTKERQSTLIDVLAKAAEHYRKQLKTNSRAIDYLKQRGLSGEVAARFAMGYAPEGWRALASAFPRYDDPLLDESGLVISQDAEADSGADSKRYDRFRDRIMFPIRSVQGEVIGFGGRVLDRGEPKYLNSPETPVFSKGRELYGLYEARTAIRQHGFVLVVEGYMDVVALAQLGFPNAVATLGTACTAEHVQKLFRFADSVVFSFDGDAAGRRAAGRALEAALPHATDLRSVRFLFLPPEHDPDSYVREHGTEGFAACIEQAVPLSRQVVAVAQEGCDLGTAEGRARFLALARPLWVALPEGALKRQLLGDLAVVAKLDTSELAGLWQTSAPKARPQVSDAAAPRPRLVRAARQGAANQLDRALWLLLHRAEMWWDLDGHCHDLLADRVAPYAVLFGGFERCLHEQGPLAPAALLNDLTQSVHDDEHARSTLERIAQFHEPEPNTDLRQQLDLILDHLRLRDVDAELEQLFESGLMSPDIQSRSAELMQSRARLKAALSSITTLPA